MLGLSKVLHRIKRLSRIIRYTSAGKVEKLLIGSPDATREGMLCNRPNTRFFLIDASLAERLTEEPSLWSCKGTIISRSLACRHHQAELQSGSGASGG
jgi:hypothetical protein